MEQIGNILHQGDSQANTPAPKNYKCFIPEFEEPTQEERKESLRKSLNISSWDNTFENFYIVVGAEKALATFKELASGKVSWFMVLLYGTTGNGKSHLCEALSIAMAKRGIRVGVSEWGELVRYWKKCMRGEIHGLYDDVFERFRRQSHMIIDDVGMGGRGSDYEWGELEDIIRYRYHENLWTVITTNLDIKPDPQNWNQPFIPERIVSRFRDAVKSRLIHNKAIDYRPKK